ncbi:MAG: hypothetical protein PHQ36_14465, partial [Anaerolineales bacterium]|nr:hypothetical protein [Anaerolineales bacterium]
MSETVKNGRAIFVSLRIKLLFGFTLLFTVVFAAAFYWFYQFATELAMQRITDDMVDTLQGAALLIDGDQFQSLYSEAAPRADGYTDDPRYWEQAKLLWQVKKIEPRAGIYTYIKGDKPDELVFVTSGGSLNNPPTGAKFLEHWTTDNIGPNLSGLSELTLQNTPEGQKNNGCVYGSSGCRVVIYSDDFGSWVSAFAPIKNSKGAVVGAVGVDFKADYVRQVQSAIWQKVYIAFGITYAALFILVYFISNVLTRPILTLTKAAGMIGEGDYENGLKFLSTAEKAPSFPDEIATLDRVFQSMVDKVYKREQTLRQQVQELKIEIDQVKRQKQVGEIVESEFFQELPVKAQKIRQQQASGKSSQ